MAAWNSYLTTSHSLELLLTVCEPEINFYFAVPYTF